MLSRYIGVSTRPMAARTMVITRKPVVKASLLVMPRNTVISLTKPLMPGRAREAKQVITNRAKVIGSTFQAAHVGNREGFGALVKDAGDKEQASGNQAVADHLQHAPLRPRSFTAAMPSSTKPMWLTELQAMRRLTLSWAKALSAPKPR